MRWQQRLERRLGGAGLLLLALQALVLTPNLAFAGGRGARTVVIPLSGEGGSADAARAFGANLEDELRSRDSVALVPAKVPDSAPAPRSSSAARSRRVADLAKASQGLLARHKGELAAKKLEEALALELEDPVSTDPGQVRDLRLALAEAHLRGGQEAKARKVLLDVARWSPREFLAKDAFPPALIREFIKAKERIRESKKVRLTVDGPSGVTLRVDGRDSGPLPYSDQLPVGGHVVQARRGEEVVWGQQVDLTSAPVVLQARVGAGGDAEIASVPVLSRTVDAGMEEKLHGYLISINASFAVVGAALQGSSGQVSIPVALYSVQARAFHAIGVASFDAKHTTGNVEAFKLADEVNQSVQEFTKTLEIPFDLGKQVAQVKGAEQAATTAAWERQSEQQQEADAVQAVEVRRKQAEADAEARAAAAEKAALEHLAQKEKEKAAAKESDAQRVHLTPLVEPRRERPLDDPPEAVGEVKAEKKNDAWVWVLTGLGLAAAAGGAYYVYYQVQRPVSGTVTANW